MSFVAVLFALLLEQIKPLPRNNVVHYSLASWVGWTGRNFDAGKPQHDRRPGAQGLSRRQQPGL